MDKITLGGPQPRIVLSDLTSEPDGWWSYRVTLETSGLTASRVVSDYPGGEPMREPGHVMHLLGVLQEAAEDYRGWKGAKRWASFEEEWLISITSDRTGHATFEVSLFESSFCTGWEVRVQVTVDVMERERLARDAEGFFARRVA